MKLPVPLVGAAARKGARGEDDELMVLDRKPAIFEQHDGSFSDEEEEEAGGEEEFDEAFEAPGGYDIVNSDGGYGHPVGERYDYEESEKSEDEDEHTIQRGVAPPEPGLWDETQPTLSSRGMFEDSSAAPGNDAMIASKSPPHPPQEQRTHALPLRRGINRQQQQQHQHQEPPAFRPLATARPSTFGNPPPPSYNAASAPQRTLPPPPPQQPKRALPDPDQTIRPAANTPPPSRPAEPTANPLLSDAELKAIPTYSALLSRLQTLYASSRSSAPVNLSTELSALLSYSHPNNDTEKVRKFIAALPDESYEAAGDIIIARKRELEDKMREAQRKRRKVVDEKVQDVSGVAEERMRRLEALRKKRDSLRGGVGKLLRENGWAVEL
ncbi:hypothetical protein FN846DRAFT_896674 [Sphaerosporella brunnea]|uniref:Uncharacterized protein n=1 Tax=Sphaerosporella brunnea TaxID=1250544 RepID=A0A5J5EC84_9PEZI|nr:hypothetical protein FN846DRAFT_896674 [Sphaerosporella brunnea]